MCSVPVSACWTGRWGAGPVGTDAATLYLYSLLSPKAVARAWDTFAEVLSSKAGRTALIIVAARVLHRAEQGDYPDLAREVRQFVTPLLQLD